MGPGGLSLDGYKGRSFKVQRHDEAPHRHRDRTPPAQAQQAEPVPPRSDGSRSDGSAVRGGVKYSKQDYDNRLVYGDSEEHRAKHAPEAVHDVEDAGYKRMPAKELQLFSGTLEKKIVRAKVSWEPRHAALTGKLLPSRVSCCLALS